MNNHELRLRVAQPGDLPLLREVMFLAIEQLQSALGPEQVRASHAIMGLDTQLVSDGTYFVVEAGKEIAGCGGWSRRATLFGGDHSRELREPRLLDPATEAARVRAMYTHPRFVRCGVGRTILAASEAAARHEGFRQAELMSTLSGERLYSSCGYVESERLAADVRGVNIPLIRMGKAL